MTDKILKTIITDVDFILKEHSRLNKKKSPVYSETKHLFYEISTLISFDTIDDIAELLNTHYKSLDADTLGFTFKIKCKYVEQNTYIQIDLIKL